MHPAEGKAAHAATTLPGARVLLPGGKGKWWVVLPPAGWEERAAELLQQEYKLVLVGGPWSPDTPLASTPPSTSYTTYLLG